MSLSHLFHGSRRRLPVKFLFDKVFRFSSVQQIQSPETSWNPSWSVLPSLPLNSALFAVTAFALVSTVLAAVSPENDKSASCQARPLSFHLSGGSSATQCDEKEVDGSENPLWPEGVTSEDVDELVDECLKDPSINISSVPDYIERQIYRSTIKLTLNAFYRSLAEMHGEPILGHEFRLVRAPVHKSAFRKDLYLLELRSDVQEQMLEEVADRLMANKAINQRLIPDVIERQLYVNCLKIMFRLLDLLATSFRLTVCGHDLRIQMEPSTRYAIQEAALRRASSSLTEIDMEVMKDIACQLFVDTSETDNERWFWQRLFHPCNNALMANIHASLYGLILGILDDLLANTELELLSDRIHFDIVASSKRAIARNGEEPAKPTSAVATRKRSSIGSASMAQPLVVFSAGVAVGATLMALLGRA